MDEQNRPDNRWESIDESRLITDSRQERILEMFGDHYWRKDYRGGGDIVASIARTILSQNQSDSVSKPAGQRLTDRYGKGDEMLRGISEASQEGIAELIHPCGPHNQKAGFIKNWCQFVGERFGTTENLEWWVEQHDPDKIREVLTTPSGVGRKTVDVVMTFTVGKPGVFAVDTHVYRVSKRLGLVPEWASREETAEILEDVIPPEKTGWGHTTMIKHGRDVCHAQNPNCDACFLEDECPKIGLNE